MLSIVLLGGLRFWRWTRGLLRSGGQRQAGDIVQNLSFLRRELTETSRLDRALTGIRWHCPQSINGIVQRSAPIRRETVKLAPHAEEVLLLLRRKVFPGFHPAEHLMLSISGKAIEPLQALLVLALGFTRESSKARVAFKSSALLVDRLLALLIEPLAGVVTLRRRLELRI